MMDAEIAVLRARLSYNSENGQLRWLNGPHAGMSAGYESHSREGLVYLNVRINRKNYRLHRVAWALHYGTWPLGVIDHIDGNPKNNAIANLRDVSVRENNTNQYKHRHGRLPGACKISGYDDKWFASIMVDGKSQYLGAFDSEESAHAAYMSKRAAIEGETK